MLMDVLKTLAKGSADSVDQLAKNLDVDKGMVNQLISQLVSMGYLKEEGAGDDGCDCSSGCGGCGGGCGCHETPVENSQKYFMLTEKGLKAAEKHM
jgi:predicted transcriptional regulator